MRLLIAAPFLVLLVLFALTNRAVVSLGLWPTGLHLEAPLSLVVLGAAGVAFLAGAVVVWVNELAQRRRARRAEAMVRRLEEEVEILRARLAAPRSAAPEPAAASLAAPAGSPGTRVPGALTAGPAAAGRVASVTPASASSEYGAAASVTPASVASASVASASAPPASATPASTASTPAMPSSRAPASPPGAR